jgi:hypothetical protein
MLGGWGVPMRQAGGGRIVFWLVQVSIPLTNNGHSIGTPYLRPALVAARMTRTGLVIPYISRARLYHCGKAVPYHVHIRTPPIVHRCVSHPSELSVVLLLLSPLFLYHSYSNLMASVHPCQRDGLFKLTDDERTAWKQRRETDRVQERS